ncbi:hypothetical protein GGI15_000955, partial [Coemansia interrupta]
HAKGAARQKKAESKRRQKEMAKIKKRQAARDFHRDAHQGKSQEEQEAVAAADLPRQMAHIYI